MNYSYDTNGMKQVSVSVADNLKVFQQHSEAIETIITDLSSSWSDPVNQQFATKYLQQGLTSCTKLENTIKSYSDLMRQCANRFGSAIDKGNGFFNSF